LQLPFRSPFPPNSCGRLTFPADLWSSSSFFRVICISPLRHFGGLCLSPRRRVSIMQTLVAQQQTLRPLPVKGQFQARFLSSKSGFVGLPTHMLSRYSSGTVSLDLQQCRFSSKLFDHPLWANTAMTCSLLALPPFYPCWFLKKQPNDHALSFRCFLSI